MHADHVLCLLWVLFALCLGSKTRVAQEHLVNWTTTTFRCCAHPEASLLGAGWIAWVQGMVFKVGRGRENVIKIEEPTIFKVLDP